MAIQDIFAYSDVDRSETDTSPDTDIRAFAGVDFPFSGIPDIDGAANLTGTGMLTANALRSTGGVVGLIGIGTIGSAPLRSTRAMVSMAGAGTIQTVAEALLDSAIALSGVGSLSTIELKSSSAIVALSGVGSISPLEQTIVLGNVNLVADGSTMFAAFLNEVPGSVTFSGVGSLTANSNIIASAIFNEWGVQM